VALSNFDLEPDESIHGDLYICCAIYRVDTAISSAKIHLDRLEISLTIVFV
jgi:hypothetical protein